jgi:hypothetical protein
MKTSKMHVTWQIIMLFGFCVQCKITNYTNIFDGNGYLAMYNTTKFTNDCQKSDEHVEKLLKE